MKCPAAAAAEASLCASPAAERCITFIEKLFRTEMQQELPDIAKLSIALGAVELPLTVKQESNQRWPDDLEQQVVAFLEAFDAFVQQMHQRLQAAGVTDARSKVKVVADAIWSKLTGSFSKDIMHAQHIYSFAAILVAGGGKGRRQLDCAGVVTTTYAVCQQLAQRYDHDDLASCRMQISEDHCWLTLDPSNAHSRLSMLEITTDTPAKRGLPPADDAGWLYTGGHAVLCSPRRAVAAVVNSLDPTVTPGKKGRDSEQLQALQYRLLSMLWREHRSAMYPAALCTLADLEEVALQDELDRALMERDRPRLDALLQQPSSGPQELFERAIGLVASWEEELPGLAERGDDAGAQGQEGTGGCCGAELMGAGTACTDVVHSRMTNGFCAAGQGLAVASPDGRIETRETQPAAGYAVEGMEAALDGSGAALDEEAAALPAAADISKHTAGEGVHEAELAPAAQPLESNAGQGLENICLPVTPGWQWYPYSFLGGFLARRGGFLGKCAAAFPASAEHYAALALCALRGGLQCCAAGAVVLARYRYLPTDDQLYKDVEGALEYCQDGFNWAAAVPPGSMTCGPDGNGSRGSGLLTDPTLLQPLLVFWDGICQLFAGKPKPTAWVALVLKLTKLFSPEARESAACLSEPWISAPMRKAQPLWGPLKPTALRPLFESADVGLGEARTIKRPRR